MNRSRQDSSVIRWTGVVMMCLVAGVPNAFSEDSERPDDVLEAQEVIVTATKVPTPMSQMTSAVEVITEETIQRQKFKTVAEALRLSQGLTVFSNGGPGTDTSVRIRGGSNTQTLVLIDGAIVNSATQGYYNFANLTTDNIERIEIIRGAQSMLWGSDAMGGVVNIVTKRGTGSPQASAFFEYGSFLSIREGGNVAGQKGPVDFSFALSRWDFTGFSAANYRLGAAERDAFRNWQASSKIGITLPHEGRLEFAFRWLDSHVNLDNISNPPRDVFGSKTRDRELIYTGTYDQRITNWWSQKITLARDEDQSLFLPGTLQRSLITGILSRPFGSPNETRTLSNRLEVQENVQVGKPLLLTVGINSANNRVKMIPDCRPRSCGRMRALPRRSSICSTASLRRGAYGRIVTMSSEMRRPTGSPGAICIGKRIPRSGPVMRPAFARRPSISCSSRTSAIQTWDRKEASRWMWASIKDCSEIVFVSAWAISGIITEISSSIA